MKKNKPVQYKILIKRGKYMKKQDYTIVLCEERSEKVKYKIGNICFSDKYYTMYINFTLIKDFWMYGNLKSKNLKKFFRIIKLLRNYNQV